MDFGNLPMRSLALPVLAVLALTMPVAASAQEAPGHCAVSVRFGSYAMGIDHAAFQRVRALLGHDRSVVAVEQQHWGREGETTLCVQLRRASDARKLFGRVKAVLPAKPRGPIVLEARGGLRFEAPRTR